MGNAQAHGIAGNRLFAGTLTFDDPAVADEFNGPIFSRRVDPLDSGSGILDRSVDFGISRLLESDLAASIETSYTLHRLPDGQTVQGIGATHLGLKKQLWIDEDHETMVAGSLTWGLGGVGRPDLHAHTYNTIEPALMAGRGFGDLPDSAEWIRPFALTGALSLDVPLSSHSIPPGETLAQRNPVILHGGISIQYSTFYRSGRFKAGQLPEEEPVDQLVPLVEIQFDQALGGTDRRLYATANPGLAYVGKTFQFSIEYIKPLNGNSGSGGLRVGAMFFLDDLMPSWFGKPLLAK